MTYTPARPRHPALAVLLNLIGQVLLLTAIPLALWRLSGNPIPKRIPSWEEIQFDWRGIEAQPSQLAWPALTVLVDLLWIVWAWHALRLAIALIWVLIRLPGAIVTGSLGAITPALAFRALSLSALASNPAPPVHTTAATAPATPAPIHPAATGPHAQAASALAVDVVEPGDNLWNLAEHYYHQGEDWHEIYDANKGAAQPDGQRLADPDLIQPGWRLAIPAVPVLGAAPNPATGAAPNPRPAPGGAGAATRPPRPGTAPQTPTPATGRPAPRPDATGPHMPAVRPQPGRTDRPHTVGIELPDGAGYIGITLAASIAAAVAILRARNRRHGQPRNHQIPELAQHIAAVHSAAVSADHYRWRQDEHPGEAPPPLYRPTDGHPILATSPDGQHEIPFDPEAPDPLVLTGPGATDAARALAISTLATGRHRLQIDPDLATDLLGTDQQPPEPADPAAPTITIRTGHHDPHEHYEPGTVLLDTPNPDQKTTTEDSEDQTASRNREPAARTQALDRQAAATLRSELGHIQPAQPATPAKDPASASAPEPPALTEHDGHDQTRDPAAIARELATTPLVLRLLDQPEILGPHGNSKLIESEQASALLTLLALHPDGIRTQQLRALEWPQADDARTPRVTMSKAISRVRETMRKTLNQAPGTADPVQHDAAKGTYRLNPTVVTTDLALIQHLTAQAETAGPDRKLNPLIQAAGLHRRQLSPNLDDYHRDWLTTARHTLVDSASSLHLRIADITADSAPETAARHLRQLAELTPDDHDAVATALRICQRLNDPHLADHLYRHHRSALHAAHERPDPEIARLARAIGEAVRRPSQTRANSA
jgi:DNA-binding SARP family transcriptional activator